MRITNDLAGLLLGVAAVTMSMPAMAAETHYVRATADNLVDSRQPNGPILAEASSRYGRSNALADYGVLKTFSTVTAYNDTNSFFFGAARASAQTFDTLTIGGRATSLPGIATVKVRIGGHVQGQADVGDGTEINSDFIYQLNSFTTGGIASEYIAANYLAIDINGVHDRNLVNAGLGYTPVASIIGYHVIKVPFLFGVPLGLQQTAGCITGVRSPIHGQGGSASCSFGNSIYWGGIESVTDGSGNVLSGWTVDSTSQFDYRVASPLDPQSPPAASPAPEPASWAMMVAGFGLAGAALRRRRMPQAAA